ncbi:MAG: SDR family oxidoreductase [Bacteroidales bacterium]|nr:SDR family oxidoreductase [Bacteroidales bacterium]
MSFSLTDKVAIITGASSGIGLAASEEFARNGARVVMASSNFENLEEKAERLKEKGYDVLPVKTDVSQEAQCKILVEKTLQMYGAIDILVNNAGISMRARFVDMDLEVIRKVMDVNFWGTVYCTRYALKHIIERKGTIVGVSSVAGFHGLPGRTGYSASKFALHGFLETVRVENLKSGMHVMIIAPGFTRTNIRMNALTGDGSIQGESPRKEEKMMTPEYVAKWIVKGIKKRKRNKIMTWEGRFTALFQRITPGLVDYAYYKAMLKEPGSPLAEK